MRTNVDVDELRRLVEVEGMRRSAVGVLGVSGRSVYRVARHFGIVVPPPFRGVKPLQGRNGRGASPGDAAPWA